MEALEGIEGILRFFWVITLTLGKYIVGILFYGALFLTIYGLVRFIGTSLKEGPEEGWRVIKEWGKGFKFGKKAVVVNPGNHFVGNRGKWPGSKKVRDLTHGEEVRVFFENDTHVAIGPRRWIDKSVVRYI